MDKYIAVIIEGGSEKAVMNVLLDNNLLKFNRTDMLEEDVIKSRKGKTFANEHLGYGFRDNQIAIFRILDSHSEKFILPRAFNRMISNITNIYTSPEIEMLFIVYNNDFDNFKNQKTDKKGKKLPAHEWCKKYYKMNDVKSPEFVYDFWNSRPDALVKTIEDYSKKCKDPFENTLASLLRDK